MKELLSGNEAIARGAYECGVTVATGYPGTPSTEILENIAKHEFKIVYICRNTEIGIGGRATIQMGF